MRNFLLSVNGSNLVQGLDGGAEPTVHAEDLAVDDGGQGQVVEDLSAVPPDCDAAILT